MEKILSGKPVSAAIQDRIRQKLLNCTIVPVMALIRIGIDPASAFYVQNVIKQAKKLELEVRLIELPADTNNSDFLNLIVQCNSNPDTHAIMIQKPLPKHIDEAAVDSIINPLKDIDGISPYNLGKLFLNQSSFVPCTATAVIEMLKYYDIKTRGKHIVILGRSSIVGKPLIGLCLQKGEFGDATVTICHSQTQELSTVLRTADILISAIGKPLFVKPDMIKQDAICLDVGINLIHDMEKGDIYVGDIDYKACFNKSIALSPVPGGIGSITTSILLDNLVTAALIQNR